VAGIEEINRPIEHANLLGTAQYTAPEYRLGELGSSRSDLFSLAVITYQMLTGKLPYGTQLAKATTKAAQKKLKYAAIPADSGIPLWVDETIRKALLPEPYKRYQEISEFIYDLRHPNKEFIHKTRPPLMERDPVIFWKSVSFILLVIILLLLASF